MNMYKQVKQWGLGVLLAGSSLLATADTGNRAPLKTGIWKAILQRADGKQIVFNFDVKQLNSKTVLYVHNASERLLVDDIRQSGDSVWITMPFFDSRFAAVVTKSGNLEGKFIKGTGERRQEIAFTALYGKKERYPATAATTSKIQGRWAVKFGEGKQSTLAVGEFQQQPGGKVTGTFLTSTGDYRFMEGSVYKDSLFLSAFDGSHVYLFAAKLDNDSTITEATMYSGATGKENWVAQKDVHAKLPDAYTAVKLRPGESKLNFSFPATSGETVSINDARYKGKVVIIQILGSWCPNCMDETAYLTEYYKKNKQRGVEVIGLAYERTTDFDASKKALATFQKRFDVKYPFLVTGVAVSDPQRTEKTLPQIEPIQGFPTSIFIDKKGNVRKIHTGYDGPATGAHYEAFKKEFNELVNGLLAE